MRKFFGFIVISLSMLIVPQFNSREALASSDILTSQPILLAQETETEIVELTIDPPLTPEQETKLQEINASYKPKLQQAAQEYIDSLKAIDDILGTNPDNETIRDRYTQAQTKRNNLSNLLLDRLLEFRAVLTPEQQASLSDDIRSYLQSQPEQQK